MKRNLVFKACGIAFAAALAGSAVAQDYPSSTIDTPSTVGPSYDATMTSDMPAYMVPVPDTSWGNLPRTNYRADRYPNTRQRGAQGPIRSDDMAMEGSRWDRTKSYFRQPVGNRGYVGFLDWRESRSDTP